MKKLSPEVAKFYKLITIRPGTHSFPNFGSIDLTKITLPEARELVADGFHFLVPLDEPKEKTNPILPIKDPTPVTEPVEVPELNETITDAENIGDELKENILDAENAGDELKDLLYQVNDVKTEPEIFRGNKKFINKLLVLNYSDLEFKEKTVFFNDEKYFNSKKYLLQDVSKLQTQMVNYHAQLKLAKTDEDRKVINGKLWIADDLKAQLFVEIDTWEHEPIPEEDPIERAARLAVAKEKEIKTLTNYIGRFESKYLKMPETTEVAREKKHKKIQEIEKRKQRLIELGSPYSRKTRS